ncbi:hypothetical protein BSUW23_19020 [Bacillus spizizenii str. W23]|uniref:Uncharacterized protein n=1 Tax=Bacillus spizizenii (strain ATCC 23059 / NRRL B-14472 / W23) TaxID=655816 RepID=E0TWQ2_BACSH|nr:hypothetical protein BSUW23_19020 [Bacillus spizizenii str. W23]
MKVGGKIFSWTGLFSSMQIFSAGRGNFPNEFVSVFKIR